MDENPLEGMDQDEVIDYLEANGYDGVAGEECGCPVDDLALCGDDPAECLPAHKRECSPDGPACPNSNCMGNPGNDCFVAGTREEREELLKSIDISK